MTKYLLYQISSNDPNNYSELVFHPIIPWNCSQVEYRIKSVNTFANFLITTSDDFITLSLNDTSKTIYFSDQSNYEIDELANTLSNILYETSVTVILNSSNTLTFSSISEFKITNASHRVKLLLGLFDQEFPISSTLSLNATSNDNINDNTSTVVYNITSPAVPMTSFGNVLYLQSLQGSAVGSRVDKNYYSAPVIYRLNTFVKSGLPIISNKKQDKIIVNTDAAKEIKIKLVDFKFEKVILKSPLFVCIKIKPA